MPDKMRAFIVGHPVKHSRSPLIHGFWLRQHGLAGSYEPVDVPPDAFTAFLEGLEAAGFRGGNVTIPHKEAAFRLVDEATDLARRLQAVNTVWIEGGVLKGDNTDVAGFTASLDQTLGPGWEQAVRTAVVLGAGGAARAILAGLLDRGVPVIVVANRTRGKAAALGDLAPDRIRAIDWSRLPGRLADADLLVNTTALGMAGQPPLTVDLRPLPGHAVVADIVYVPLETDLLARARARGLRTVDGLGMLLHQAVPGFARWFGVTPRVSPALRAAIAADIEGRP